MEKILKRLGNLDSEIKEISEKITLSYNSKQDYTHLIEEAKQKHKQKKLYEKYMFEIRQLQEIDSILVDEMEDHDDEMVEYLQESILKTKAKLESIGEEIKESFIKKDLNDSKNVIIEIITGAGGLESSLFAQELMTMYLKFAEFKKYQVEVINLQRNSMGGVKEVVLSIKGRNVYSYFKYEIGVHRVQRVPKTERKGRTHTSTVGVSIFPESDLKEVEVQLKDQDLEISTFCSSGPGGQHMQKNETAVRIIHKPTGLVSSCQSGRSQFQNKQKAKQVLMTRLYNLEKEKREKELGKKKGEQLGNRDRSMKIRTYNFSQNRLTDHRILQSWNLQSCLNGQIEPVIKSLRDKEIQTQIESLEI